MNLARLLAQPFALPVRRRLPSPHLSIPLPHLRVTLKLLIVVGISILGVLASEILHVLSNGGSGVSPLAAARHRFPDTC